MGERSPITDGSRIFGAFVGQFLGFVKLFKKKCRLRCAPIGIDLIFQSSFTVSKTEGLLSIRFSSFGLISYSINFGENDERA